MYKTNTLKHPYYLKSTTLILAFIFSIGLIAQDLHYSQVGNSPLNLSPALTGSFSGNHRLIGNFRNQWQQVPVPYTQLAGAWDWRLTDKKEKQLPWAVGAIFNYDQQGDAELSLSQLGLNAAYAIRLAPKKNHFLTIGANVTFNQRSFDPTGLNFADQYTIKEGLTTEPTKEIFTNTKRGFVALGTGVNLRLKSDEKRSKLDVGVGAFHLNEPKQNFQDDVEEPLNKRWSSYALGTVMLADKFDLLMHAMGQFQGENQEVLIGAGGLFHLNQTKTQELAVQAGLGYRFDDALIPWVGLHYQNWQFHLSYDINTSALRGTNSRRGGPEISVIYIITKVPGMEYCKHCPTYM